MTLWAPFSSTCRPAGRFIQLASSGVNLDVYNMISLDSLDSLDLGVAVEHHELCTAGSYELNK